MTTKDESSEPSKPAPPAIVATLTPDGELDHKALLHAHLHRFSSMTDDEKSRFADVLSQGFKALTKSDATSEEATGKIIKHKMKFWTVIVLLSVVAVNITALITAILVIGVRNNTLPDIGPINSLIQFALEILKTVFAA